MAISVLDTGFPTGMTEGVARIIRDWLGLDVATGKPKKHSG